MKKMSYTPYKGRLIDENKPVRLYRNLHNGKISIKQGTLVVGHTEEIIVRCARFIVSEKNRQKVLLTKRKNVHAYVEGYVCESASSGEGLSVWYNPYKTDCFRLADNGLRCESASYVRVTADGKIEAWI